jgi:acetoacetate decarboxylase
MPRTRFISTPEHVRDLLAALRAPVFEDIRSLTLTFRTEPGVLAELLPPPLEPADQPRASVTVAAIGRSNCVGAFNGASINLACRFRGEDGFYCLTMPMSTDTAVTFGRELYAEPKKLADILLEVTGGRARGTVRRHGVTYIELHGRFDEPMITVEQSVESKHFYFKYLPQADGSGLAGDPELVCVTHHGIVHRSVSGTGTITFRESRHDPVVDLPVVSIEGASLSETETRTEARVVARVPARDFLPWAFGKMDDLTAWRLAPAVLSSTASPA